MKCYGQKMRNGFCCRLCYPDPKDPSIGKSRKRRACRRAKEEIEGWLDDGPETDDEFEDDVDWLALWDE